jgi:hypothetical protein
MAFFNFPTAKSRDVLFSEASGSSTTLRAGQFVVSDPTAVSSVNDTRGQVTRPTLAMLPRPGYIVHPSSDSRTTDQKVKVIPVSDIGENRISVWTDQNIAAGDILGPQPGTHNLRRGALFTPYGFRALEAQDRSSTAGLVLCDLIPVLTPMDRIASQYEYFDDFHRFTIGEWTSTETEAGAGDASLTITDEVGGVLLITNDAADNDVVNLQLIGEQFKLATGKTLFFEARVKISDATQSDFAIGLAATDTSLIAGVQDNALFTKADGSTSVAFDSDKDGTATTVSAVLTADTSYHKYGFYFDGRGVLYIYVDGVLNATTVSTNVCDDEEMRISLSIQNGEAVAKTMSVDWIRCVQAR